MDPVLSIVLISVVSILTILLVAVGIQAFLILHSAKKTFKKLNELLDDAQVLTNSVARPVQGLTHLVEGVKNIRSIMEFTSGLVNKKSEELKPARESVPAVVEDVASPQTNDGFYNYNRTQENRELKLADELDSDMSFSFRGETTDHLVRGERHQSLAMEEEEPYYEERTALLLKEDKPHPIHKIQERGRRFFHRAGKPLTS